MAAKDHAERVALALQALVRGLARGDGPFELFQALKAIAIKGDLDLARKLADTLGISVSL